MLNYILILFAVLAMVGASSMELLIETGSPMQYLVAFAIALMLKPWLKSHFD